MRNRLTDVNNGDKLNRMKEKHLKVTEKDHREIKTLASRAGKTIMAFMSDLISAYKGKK